MKLFWCIGVLVLLESRAILGAYDPTWDSLDSRPLPDWYDKAKIGIFLHWGVYAVPSFGSEWFWYSWENDQSPDYVKFMNDNYPPGFTYQDFAKEFTAEFYDPVQWADLFAKSGAKYVVLTSKHHEGYTLWPSMYSYSWNAYDVGPHRDLLGELAEAVKERNLRFGLYHSLLEWFHPLYKADKQNNWETTTFVDSKILPEMQEIINNYHPEILWSDGNWEAPDTYWKATEFLAWLYNESPVNETVVTNDRWGWDTGCNHGGFFSCADRYNPGTLQAHKWENAMTVDRVSWGYRRNANLGDILSQHELIETIAQTVSCGGNILINVGPTKEGTIIPIFQQRLMELGEWLGINGEAIYESVPWSVQNDTLTPGVWYTAKPPSVYAIVLQWPADNVLGLGSVAELFSNELGTDVVLLGNEDIPIDVELGDVRVNVNFPDKAIVNSQWAWILKMTPRT